MKIVKKVISVILAFIMIFNFEGEKAGKVNAKKTQYITVNAFMKELVESMKLTIDTNSDSPYIAAAYEAKILKEGEFKNFNQKITRAECAVILDRADEYLFQTKLKKEYLNRIIKHRISDLKKIDKAKRKAVAKVYGKGIIKGYSNGIGVQSRQFRGNKYLTRKDASSYIEATVNKKKRAKMSPYGQVIRTKNLPKNADKFEYILECYPNEFYEKKFFQELLKSSRKLVEEKDFYYPINLRKKTCRNMIDEFDMGQQMDWYMDDWVKYTEKYVKLLFNVDYKKTGKKWMKDLMSVMVTTDRTKGYLKDYVDNLSNHKIKIQTRKISVEPSTMYFCRMYHLRVYIEYKITADSSNLDFDEYVFSLGGDKQNFQLNKWMTGYFDIMLSTIDITSGRGESFRPDLTYFASE